MAVLLASTRQRYAIDVAANPCRRGLEHGCHMHLCPRGIA